MAFETYIPKTRRQAPEPQVAVSAGGVFSLNAAAHAAWFADTPAVRLLYERDSRTVAIQPAAAEADHTLKLRRPARAAGAHVSAAGFLELHQLAAGKRRTFPLSWRDDLNAAVFTVPAQGGQAT